MTEQTGLTKYRINLIRVSLEYQTFLRGYKEQKTHTATPLVGIPNINQTADRDVLPNNDSRPSIPTRRTRQHQNIQTAPAHLSRTPTLMSPASKIVQTTPKAETPDPAQLNTNQTTSGYTQPNNGARRKQPTNQKN